MYIWTYNWVFKTWSSLREEWIQDLTLNYFELCLPKPLSLYIPIICTHRHLLTSASCQILSPSTIAHGRSFLCDKTMTQRLLNILQQTLCVYWWSRQAKTIHVSLSINSKDWDCLIYFHLWEYFLCVVKVLASVVCWPLQWTVEFGQETNLTNHRDAVILLGG